MDDFPYAQQPQAQSCHGQPRDGTRFQHLEPLPPSQQYGPQDGGDAPQFQYPRPLAWNHHGRTGNGPMPQCAVPGGGNAPQYWPPPLLNQQGGTENGLSPVGVPNPLVFTEPAPHTPNHNATQYDWGPGTENGLSLVGVPNPLVFTEPAQHTPNHSATQYDWGHPPPITPESPRRVKPKRSLKPRPRPSCADWNPLPQYYVLLGSAAHEYRTIANNIWDNLIRPQYSRTTDPGIVQKMREELHEQLKMHFGPNVPEPVFCIQVGVGKKAEKEANKSWAFHPCSSHKESFHAGPVWKDRYWEKKKLISIRRASDAWIQEDNRRPNEPGSKSNSKGKSTLPEPDSTNSSNDANALDIHSAELPDSRASHQDLRKEIKKCETLSAFQNVLENPSFKKCLVTLENKQAGEDRFNWAVSWTEHLHEDKEPEEAEISMKNKRTLEEWLLVAQDKNSADKKEEASALQEARRTLTRWLFRLVDGVIDQEKQWYTTEALIKLFHYEIARIVLVVLPMDRAFALYGLIDRDGNRQGKPWYAKVDTEIMKRVGAITSDGGHTMNKRYLWLFDVFREWEPNSDLFQVQYCLEKALSPIVWYGIDVVQAAKFDNIAVLPDAIANDPELNLDILFENSTE